MNKILIWLIQYEGNSMEISKKIKIARVQKKLSQKDLAEKIGISQSYLSKIENGYQIKKEKIFKLLEFLKISINFGDGYESN